MQPSFVQADFDLSRLNTLGVPSRAQFFAAVKSVADLAEAYGWA